MLTNSQVKKTIKQVAESIAAVLNVDILIVDKNFKIVGGTAEHQGKYQISNNTVYKHVMSTGMSIVIENPGFNELCKKCGLYENCLETAEIDCPIILNDEVIGIISLVGLTEKHRKMMLSRKEDYLVFLKRMSELIATKTQEVSIAQELNYVAQQLTCIIDSVQEGIIAVEENGRITHCNKPAEKILKIRSSSIIGKSIEAVIPGFPFSESMYGNISFTNKELNFTCKKGKNIHCYISSSPITNADDKKIVGAIITIADAQDINKIVSNMMGFHHKNVYFSDIIGKSRLLTKVKQQALKAAGSSSTILIRGESGTGKELFARAIHNRSSAHNGPFITVNCAAIPETLLESELFGYEGGAFTGAKKEGKPGKFELAYGGTLFLDEIGDMSLYLQAKLLRVLQDKRIQRVGGIKEVLVDVRIITATNKNLENLVAQHRFREDLFYRLNVIPIFIPSISERREDIPDLVEYLLNKYNNLFEKKIVGLQENVKKIFVEYSWPGNVREIENVLEYAMNMENGNYINLNSIPDYLVNTLDSQSDKESLKQMVCDFEKRILHSRIQRYGADLNAKNRIAEELDIGIASLYRKLKKYNL